LIIDAHAHVWPDDLAPRVLQRPRAGNQALFDGTVSGLLRSMDEAGIDRSICLGVAQSGKYVHRVNEFAATLNTDRLVGFGTVHPELSAAENLRSLRENGLAGVKIHPLYQGYGLDDPCLHDIFAALGSEFAFIIHAGSGEDPVANERGAPAKLRDLINRFPESRIIACHFGGYLVLDQAKQFVLGTNVHLETAWPKSLDELDPALVRELMTAHGLDRIIFGSDWPMTNPRREIAAIRALGLDPAAEAGVLGGNIARVLGLEES